MLQKLKDKLAKKNISAWQIGETKSISHQSFLAKNTREMTRTADTIQYDITIHLNKKGGMMGLANFQVGPLDLENFDKKLENALFSANLVQNKPFNLPQQPDTLPDVLLNDTTLNKKSLHELEDRIRTAVGREKNTRLSTAEFFINNFKQRLLNNAGLDVSQESSVIQTEFILLSQNQGAEKEFINRYQRRFMSDFDLEEEISASALYAREATQAVLPKTGAFPVIISEEPLDNLYNPITARASARLKFNKMIKAELNKNVLEEGEVLGDRITLWSNGIEPGMRGSKRFDQYGTPANRTCLIKDNKLNHFLADKRYADYLALPASGDLGNLEVEPGVMSFDDLFKEGLTGKGPLYHLTAFSAFEPNQITGAFSAEIRAGYEITANGARPIKGGSVSGILQKDLLNCRLSKERVKRERVLVPKGILFKSLNIAGE